jgi:hypothetical protein
MIPSPDDADYNAPIRSVGTPADDQLTTFYREIGISAVAAALNAMVESMRRADDAKAKAPVAPTGKHAA